MATKKERQKIVIEKTEAEKQRILKIMRDADIYTLTLDPLIESYLDAYEIYNLKHLEWKEKGCPETQRHTNKAGATNNSKHPLAQQVEVWFDKKLKCLEKLGLTSNAKLGKFVTGGSSVRKDDEMKKPEAKVDELTSHRNKWRNAK